MHDSAPLTNAELPSSGPQSSGPPNSELPNPPSETTRSPWPRRALWGICALLLVRAATLSVLPLVDSTESRYAQVAADMAELGDWSVPKIRIHDHLVPFEGKPPLHFWLGAMAVEVFGRGEVAARLPSLLALLATGGLLLTLGRRVVGTESARAATLLFAMGPLAFLLAGTVVVDGTLTFCTTGAILLGLAHDPRGAPGRRRRSGALMGVFLGLGFLTKGPIALATVGSAGLAVCLTRRSLDPLRGQTWLTGGLTFLAVASPWFIARELASPGFLSYFFIQENLLRFTSSNIGDRYGNVHEFFRGVSLAWWAVAALPLLVSLPFALRAQRSIALRAQRRQNASSAPLHGGDAPTARTIRHSPFPEIVAASLAIAVVLSPSRNILATYLLPSAPIAALAGGLLWTRSNRRLETLGTAALLLAVVYGGGIVAAKGRVSSGKSARDALVLARQSCLDLERSEIVFPRKTPWSAYYYGGALVVPRAADRYLMRVHETLAEHPDALYIFKRRELRKFTDDLHARFEFIGESGQWHLAIRRSEGDLDRAPSAGTMGR